MISTTRWCRSQSIAGRQALGRRSCSFSDTEIWPDSNIAAVPRRKPGPTLPLPRALNSGSRLSPGSGKKSYKANPTSISERMADRVLRRHCALAEVLRQAMHHRLVDVLDDAVILGRDV